MGLNIVVCVPLREGDPERDRVWRFCVQALWGPITKYVRLVTADDPCPGEFRASRARNAAARLAGDWDVMIVADADLVAPASQVLHAAAAASRGKRMVAAHHELIRLSRRATADVVSYSRSPDAARPRAEANRHTWESIRAISRPLWDEIGGFDERLVASDGIAYLEAAMTLGECDRRNGIVYHLWHEPRWEDREQKHRDGPLLDQYKAARGNPDEIRALAAGWRS